MNTIEFQGLGNYAAFKEAIKQRDPVDGIAIAWSFRTKTGWASFTDNSMVEAIAALAHKFGFEITNSLCRQ